MRSIAMFVGFAVLASVSGCSSAETGEMGTGTVGQALSQRDTTHTGVGALVRYNGTRLSQLCSGVLISPTVFLTAAHCTEAVGGSGAAALVTFDSKVTDGSPVLAGTAYTSPSYNPSHYNINEDSNDVGVIVLAAPVTGRPIAELPSATLLANANPRPGTPITAVGYGRDQSGASGGQVTYVNDKTRDYGTLGFRALNAYIVADQVQADGVCFGDSGGPSYMMIGGVERLVAVNVVVNGYDCNEMAWLYRLDSPATRAFLGQYVALP
jgi:secreted trypsin-like serine protease